MKSSDNIYTLYLPSDAMACALGADSLAVQLATDAKKARLPLHIVRTGSRGMAWLEPLIEMDTPSGRVGWGPMQSNHVPTFIAMLAAAQKNAGVDAAQILTNTGKNIFGYQGLVAELPWLKKQQRLIFQRCAVVDPTSLSDYQAHGGGKALAQARKQKAEEIISAITASGLRGRGGAAFPAGIKWRTVMEAQGAQKYIVCNADEGDSGSFSDRMIIEGDPFRLLESMAIAGLAVGASEGYIYLRSEYPHAIRTLTRALANAKDWLGEFQIQLRVGAGSYVCGEETALLESIEGRRGMVRAKPPIPALQGLFQCPTLIHNVITLASVPEIIEQGASVYQALGCGRSRGTMPFQLSGNIRYGGLVEIPFGMTLRDLLYDFGGGSLSGRPLRAVQVGGPLGAYFPEAKFDTVLDYEAFAAEGGGLGHGGIVAFDDTVDMSAQARWAMEFCAIESCGKCTPCRIGSVRGVEVIDQIRAQKNTTAERIEKSVLLRDLCDTMIASSLCAMGGMTPNPVLSAINYFPEDFGLPKQQP